MRKPEFYYRMEEDILWEGSELRVALYQYRVTRRTPKGCFIEPNGYCTLGFKQHDRRSKDRFILDGARKRYAYPTIEEAKASFIARKESRLAYLKRDRDFAQAALDTAKREDFAPNTTFKHDLLSNYHVF